MPWTSDDKYWYDLVNVIKFKGEQVPDIVLSMEKGALCVSCGKESERHGAYIRNGKIFELCPGDWLVEGIIRRPRG